MIELKDFHKWMLKKKYIIYMCNDDYIFTTCSKEYKFVWTTDVPKQMLIGYMYEYINELYKNLKSNDYTAVLDRELNNAWFGVAGLSDHFQSLKNIIKKLEGFNAK